MSDLNIGIYIYDEAEVLDFSGPFEVLSTARRLAGLDWKVLLIGETRDLVHARGGYPVMPHCSIYDHPPIDVLIVSGGVHTSEMKKRQVIEWIERRIESSRMVVSVCTGVFLLAQAGLPRGLEVTTHWEDIKDLESLFPELTVEREKRWVSRDKYITSGGISAGIDMSLYLVSKLVNRELAERTARQMEYIWQTTAE